MTDDHSKPVRMALAALQAWQARKPDRARDLVVRISAECGGKGLYLALMAWCDAYADHATDGHAGGPLAAANIKVVETATGRLLDPRVDDDVPLDVAWASALLQARGALDEAWFDDLVAKLPDTGMERGRYIMSALSLVADSINGFPRGFARMGKVQP